ncbi:GSK3B-interacting protein-like [Balaenoptera musculus]|uniref:GSK3B-interacting protein-like n=1 Tax=Balaenoptera musculus TaxID=9771 RepID=A0A8B8YXJ8_BALMU|nr:GSK3B-interacting protein-like [Balaenoptera musculus]
MVTPQRRRPLTTCLEVQEWRPSRTPRSGRCPLGVFANYFCRTETDCNPMELSSVSAFEEDAELNGFEGTDMKDMRLEAEAVVNDVLFAVNTMFVSKTLRCADDVAYINVETRERNRYCLELTEAGLRVVGYAFDQVDDHLQTPYHETVYSLLDTLSPAYREAFRNALLQRLEALKRDEQS